jgi:diadenylate cyclase
LHIAQVVMQASRYPLLDSYIHRLQTGFAIPWQAVIELVLIGVVVYWTLRFLEGTRGARLLRAVLLLLTVLLLVAIFAQLLELERIIFLYPYFVGGVFLIALVVFQPELRRGLMRIGDAFARWTLSADTAPIIEPVVQAAASLSKRKIGALIAIERGVAIGGVIETGVRIDASVTRELLETIFWPGSTLHDLGVIISRGRVAAASCLFPLAEPEVADRALGSRHRAALGLTLDTDTLVLVISEETGQISVAERGRLQGPLTPETLRAILAARLLERAGEDLTDSEADEADSSIHAAGEDKKRAAESMTQTEADEVPPRGEDGTRSLAETDGGR